MFQRIRWYTKDKIVSTRVFEQGNVYDYYENITVQKVTCPILQDTYHIQEMKDGLHLLMKAHQRDLKKLLHQRLLEWQVLFLRKPPN